jgi:hypothetical protein
VTRRKRLRLSMNVEAARNSSDMQRISMVFSKRTEGGEEFGDIVAALEQTIQEVEWRVLPLVP